MNILSCEYCDATHRECVILEKPKRYGYKGDIFYTAKNNRDGREQDNMCSNCLISYLELLSKEHLL